MSDPKDYKTGCIYATKSYYVAAQAFLDKEHHRPNMEKVDVDSKDSDGRTPLSWAMENSHEAVVKLLLDIEKGCLGKGYFVFPYTAGEMEN